MITINNDTLLIEDTLMECHEVLNKGFDCPINVDPNCELTRRAYFKILTRTNMILKMNNGGLHNNPRMSYYITEWKREVHNIKEQLRRDKIAKNIADF